MAGRSLRSYLESSLNDAVDELESKLETTRKSRDSVGDLNTNNADYIVRLVSMWDGEESVERKFQGVTLKKAIQDAEAEFRKVNSRSDVQARYKVKIKVGDVSYPVPKEYWQKHAED